MAKGSDDICLSIWAMGLSRLVKVASMPVYAWSSLQSFCACALLASHTIVPTYHLPVFPVRAHWALSQLCTKEIHPSIGPSVHPSIMRLSSPPPPPPSRNSMCDASSLLRISEGHVIPFACRHPSALAGWSFRHRGG
jgi:hypothetical protein